MTGAALLQPRPLAAILFALGGSVGLSLNDLAVKFLSGGYALHQVMLIRTLIAACVLVFVIVAGRTGFAQLRTRRWREHLFRVTLIMVSNVAFFMGLAAMPLAEGVAVGFVAPLLITAMSVVVLGETVGPRRWAAVGVGLLGVVIMLRPDLTPGSGVIQPAALLVLLAATCYGAGHLMTRRMRETESAMTMNFWVLAGFFVVSCVMGLITSDGRFAGSADLSLDFLLRAWVWPASADWPVFLLLGVSIALGGLMIAQAYRLGEAGLVAPFEYVAMPLAIFWGVTVFGEWPDAVAWAGMALIVGAGLYAMWREAIRRGAR